MCHPEKNPCRPLSIHQQTAFKQQMAEMQATGIIQTIQPCYSFSLLIKHLDIYGKPQLCICLHPSNLNQIIARDTFYYRTPDDIFHKLSQTKKITIVHFNKGYYHIKLDEASPFLTTFNTTFGRFWFPKCHLTWLLQEMPFSASQIQSLTI